MDKIYYDSIPVFYCKKCLSLAIKYSDLGIPYCLDCGSGIQGRTLISLWQEMVNNGEQSDNKDNQEGGI